MEIIGNENALAAVDALLSSGRTPHSIVIYGEKGLGKRSLAKYIAARMLCKSAAASPCGICRSCVMLARGGHPDFIQVQPSLKSGAYKLDEDLRFVAADAVTAPNESSVKIYLIADMDKTPVGSQNALLKLIEEPPDHVVIILTASSKEYFLPTILSRVIAIGMSPVTAEQCAEYLKKHSSHSSEEIAEAVSAMGGNIGMCLEYLESKGLRAAAETARLAAKATADRNEYELMKALSVCDKDRELTVSMLKLLQNIFRDAYLAALGCTIENCGCCAEASEKMAASLSVSKLGELCSLSEKYIFRINANAGLQLCLCSLCADIKNITG